MKKSLKSLSGTTEGSELEKQRSAGCPGPAEKTGPGLLEAYALDPDKAMRTLADLPLLIEVLARAQATGVVNEMTFSLARYLYALEEPDPILGRWEPPDPSRVRLALLAGGAENEDVAESVIQLFEVAPHKISRALVTESVRQGILGDFEKSLQQVVRARSSFQHALAVLESGEADAIRVPAAHSDQMIVIAAQKMAAIIEASGLAVHLPIDTAEAHNKDPSVSKEGQRADVPTAGSLVAEAAAWVHLLESCDGFSIQRQAAIAAKNGDSIKLGILAASHRLWDLDLLVDKVVASDPQAGAYLILAAEATHRLNTRQQGLLQAWENESFTLTKRQVERHSSLLEAVAWRCWDERISVPADGDLKEKAAWEAMLAMFTIGSMTLADRTALPGEKRYGALSVDFWEQRPNICFEDNELLRHIRGLIGYIRLNSPEAKEAAARVKIPSGTVWAFHDTINAACGPANAGPRRIDLARTLNHAP